MDLRIDIIVATRAFLSSDRFVFDLLPANIIEIFIGIMLRRISWKIEQRDLALVFGEPFYNSPGMMDSQIIQNQEDFLSSIPHQP